MQPRIVIVMEGGLIQGVCSDEAGVDVLVCDYDIDGIDEESSVYASPDGSKGYHTMMEANKETGLVEAWFSRALLHLKEESKNEKEVCDAIKAST